ncbi:MAG: hypothetical protein GF331_09765 [Chitinivibrionales bacterium]|nr:hypothetical protein [Chitinivibrionales bacterium]
MSRSRLIALSFTLLISLSLPVSVCRAVTVVRLKNGQTFSGSVVDQSGNFLTLRVDGRDVKILRSIIASIDSSGQAAAEGKGKPAPPPPAPKKTVQQQNVPQQKPPAESPAAHTPASAEEHTFRLSNGGTMRGAIVSDRGNFVRILVGGRPVNILKSIIAEVDGKPYGAEQADEPPPAKAPAKQEPSITTKPEQRQVTQHEEDGDTAEHAPRPAPGSEPSPEPVSRQPSVSARAREPKEPASAPKPPPDSAAKTAGQPAPSPVETASQKPPAVQPTPRVAPETRIDSQSVAGKETGTPDKRVGREPAATTAPAKQPGDAPKAPQEVVSVPAPVPLVEPSRMSGELRPLVEQLGSRDALQQAVAAMRIATIGPAAAPAAPYLIRNLRNAKRVRLSKSRDNEKTVGQAAAEALVAIGEPSVGGLVRALEHSEPAMRRQAAWALGELKNAAAIVPLMDAITDPEDPVRASVVEALGKIRDPRSIPVLVTTMNQDESPLVRSAAESALRKVTEIPMLIEGLKDPSPLVTNNSAYILWLMTAKEFRTDVTAWEQWWRGQQRADSAPGQETAEVQK